MPNGVFMRRRTIILIGFVTVLFGIAVPAAAEPPEGVTITFMHFNDLHAHLTPHADVVPDAPPGQTAAKTKIVERGGLARFATLIKRIRAENPHSFLMNIGDTYHGGVEAFYTNGNAIVEPVNVLGIDVGVPGNWDFAYGPIVTRRRYTDLPVATILEAAQGPRRRFAQFRGQRNADVGSDDAALGHEQLQAMTPAGEVKRPNFPNLAANVTLKFPPLRRGQTMLPPTLMKSVAGVKTGFIGITSDIVPRMHPLLAFGLSFLEGEGNYRALIERHARELRDRGAQLVVVMSELGLHKDYCLAQIIAPGTVDVFFSAHTHEAVFEPLTSKSGALVVEAGNDGYLGRMDITVKDGAVTARRWKLIPVGNDIPEDGPMKALVDRERAPFLAPDVNMQSPMPMVHQRLTQPIDTVLGRTEGPLDRHRALESTFNNAMTDALRRLAGTQVAMTPGFRFDAAVGAGVEDNTVVNGKVTVEDIYRFFPAPYDIAIAEVSGRRLREVMEEGLTYVFSPDVFKQSGGWFEGFSGLGVTLDLSRPDGRRIRELRLTGSNRLLTADSRVTITGCTRPFESFGTLCGYSGFDHVRPFINPNTGSAWTPVDILAYALSQDPLPPATRRDMTELNRTPVWPETPFVQPLAGTH